MQADPPEPSKIPEEDIIGVTVLLLTCSYVGQEFLRVGYYVSNEYVDEALREEPPARILIDRVQRNILADKPRVTKFPIICSETPALTPSVANALVMDAEAPAAPIVDVAIGSDSLVRIAKPMELDDGLRPMESSPSRPHEQWKAPLAPIECN